MFANDNKLCISFKSDDSKDRSIFVNSSISTGSLVDGNIAASSQVLSGQNGCIRSDILGNVGSNIFGEVSSNILGGINLHLGSRIGEEMDTLICSLVLLGSGVHRDILGQVGSNISGRVRLLVSNGLLLWSCSSVVSGILSFVGGHVSGSVTRDIGGLVLLGVDGDV